MLLILFHNIKTGVYFTAILLMFSVYSFSQQYSSKIQNKSINLSLTNPGKSIICIKNTGDKPCMFNLKLNNQFYESSEDVLKKIKSREIEGGKKPEHYRAWWYIKSLSYPFEGISDNVWPCSINLMLNSLGFGNSQQLTHTLNLIWNKTNFISQMSTMHHYYYPEVFIENRWELYDVFNGLYFLNSGNKTAGLNEISNDSSITKNYVLHKTTGLNCNKINEQINFHYKNKKTEATLPQAIHEIADSMIFYLPKGGKIEFPAIFDSDVKTYNHTPVPYFAQLKLTLPEGWGGFLNYPFIVHSIKGKGIVEINKKEFRIGSPEIAQEIQTYESFINTIKIIKSEKDVEIIYLINPLNTKLQFENILKFEGYHIDRLDITFPEIHDSLTIEDKLYNQKFFYHTDRIKLFQEKESIEHPEFKSIEDLINFSEIYFNQIGKTERGSSFIKGLKDLNKKIPAENKKSDIIICLLNLPFNMILFDFENNEPDKILSKIQAIGNMW